MWRFLDRGVRSHALAATLLSCIAVASVPGTVPRDGADSLYWTWWYSTLLVALAVLMAYVTARRLPAVIRAVMAPPPEAVWARPDLVVSDVLAVPSRSQPTVRERMTRALRARGFRLRAPDPAAPVFEKGRAGMLGPPFVHLGLVIAFVGGGITHRYGSVRDIELAEGEVVEVPELQARLSLAKFSVVVDPRTRQPDAYVSTLRISPREGEPRLRHLRVNQPLLLEGARLFQMRYRPEFRTVRLAVYAAETREALGVLRLGLGVKTLVPGTAVAVRLERVVPDFAVDARNIVQSRSPYYLNPAVRIAVFTPADAPAPVWTGWVYQDTSPAHDESSAPLSFTVAGVQVRYYSGIKISHDPGVPVAYGGFLFLVVGAFLSAYVSPRTVRVEYGGGAGDLTVRLSGYSAKHQRDFAYEWTRLLTDVRRALAE